LYHNKIFFTSLSKTRRGERPQEGGWGYRTGKNTIYSWRLVIYRVVGLRPDTAAYGGRVGVLYGAIACLAVPYCYRLYNIVKLYSTSIVNMPKVVTMCTSGQRSWYTVYYVPIHIGYIRFTT